MGLLQKYRILQQPHLYKDQRYSLAHVPAQRDGLGGGKVVDAPGFCVEGPFVIE